MKIACVLLAAGAGKRFGGGKLLYEVGGEPMIAHALRLYALFPFRARVCVTRGEERMLQSLAQESGFNVAINPEPERGVGTSVSIGTQTALLLEPELDGILYAVSDQPYLERTSVQRLLDAFGNDSNQIVSLSFQRTRGNPAVFPKSLFGELSQLSEDLGGGAVIRKNPQMLRLVEANDARELEDLDTLPEHRQSR